MSELADVERTLNELIELGGAPLAVRWPGVGDMRRLARAAAAATDGERAELVARLRGTANAIYGGYGSFLDYAIDGPDADRFERLKDRLSREIGQL